MANRLPVRTTLQRNVVLFLFCVLYLVICTPATSAQQKQPARYICPMHADVTAKLPGKCPKCGMALKKNAAPIDKQVETNQDHQNESAPPRIPNLTVYDQQGRKLQFFTDLVKDKTVAINFIFTTCTTICPPLTATFRKVQQELGARVGHEVQLISISVDPTTDGPERLLSFAAKFEAGPGWSFVTGGKPEIDALLKALGAGVADKNDHTPLVLIGNERAGYWTRAYGLAPASTLLKKINEAAAKPPLILSPAASAERYFPNHTLLTQNNQPVRFFDDLLKGKTVLINLMFATCTGVCSPMTANLAKVQAALGDRVGRDINMISITVDPLVDTPAALKRYAESFNIKPGWLFLTGKKENVDGVLSKIGGYVEDKNQHNNLLIVGNVESGEWVKVFAMAKAEEIASIALRVANGKKK